jgi:hypothetical protein
LFRWSPRTVRGLAKGTEVMRKHTGFLIGSFLFGVCGVGSALGQEPVRIAQSEPPASSLRERAPGVPLAPDPGLVERRESVGTGNGGNAASKPRSTRQANDQAEANGDLPMPRGVPSIIAP